MGDTSPGDICPLMLTSAHISSSIHSSSLHRCLTSGAATSAGRSTRRARGPSSAPSSAPSFFWMTPSFFWATPKSAPKATPKTTKARRCIENSARIAASIAAPPAAVAAPPASPLERQLVHQVLVVDVGEVVAAELAGPSDHAVVEVEWRFESDDLFDVAGDQRRLLAQLVGQRRALRQDPERRADQGGGRLSTRTEHDDRNADRLSAVDATCVSVESVRM